MHALRRAGLVSVSVVASLGMFAGNAHADMLGDLLKPLTGGTAAPSPVAAPAPAAPAPAPAPAAAPAPVPVPAAPVSIEALEARFVELLNASRAGAGLAPLGVQGAVLPVARDHSTAMASAGSIWHNPSLATQVTAGWKLLGENVGVGGSVESLHQAFMDSPGHRANVLGPFDQVTIGIATSGSQLFVTEVFWSSADAGPAKATAGKAKAKAKAAKGKKARKASGKGKAKKASSRKKASTKAKARTR